MPILASFNLLAVNPGLLIWTVITFSVVLTVLWLFAWKPIIAALDSRNEKVEGDLQKSKELREEAEKLLMDYEKKLDSIKSEANQLIDEGRKDAEVLKEKILKEAREEAERINVRTEQDIHQAKLRALDEIENSVVDMTVSALSKILTQEVKAETHKAVILREITEIRQKKAG